MHLEHVLGLLLAGALIGAFVHSVIVDLRPLRPRISGAPPLGGVKSLLAEPERLRFHYIGRATRPDLVEVWRDDRVVYTYNWIDGADAAPWSDLGQLQALFKKSRASGKDPSPQ